MQTGRRKFIHGSFVAAAAAVSQSSSRAEDQKLGIPGPYPGRVIAVEHSGSHCVRRLSTAADSSDDGARHDRADRAPSWADSWRSFFNKETWSESRSVPSEGRSSAPTFR